MAFSDKSSVKRKVEDYFSKNDWKKLKYDTSTNDSEKSIEKLEMTLEPEFIDDFEETVVSVDSNVVANVNSNDSFSAGNNFVETADSTHTNKDYSKENDLNIPMTSESVERTIDVGLVDITTSKMKLHTSSSDNQPDTVRGASSEAQLHSTYDLTCKKKLSGNSLKSMKSKSTSELPILGYIIPDGLNCLTISEAQILEPVPSNIASGLPISDRPTPIHIQNVNNDGVSSSYYISNNVLPAPLPRIDKVFTTDKFFESNMPCIEPYNNVLPDKRKSKVHTLGKKRKKNDLDVDKIPATPGQFSSTNLEENQFSATCKNTSTLTTPVNIPSTKKLIPIRPKPSGMSTVNKSVSNLDKPTNVRKGTRPTSKKLNRPRPKFPTKNISPIRTKRIKVNFKINGREKFLLDKSKGGFYEKCELCLIFFKTKGEWLTHMQSDKHQSAFSLLKRNLGVPLNDELCLQDYPLQANTTSSNFTDSRATNSDFAKSKTPVLKFKRSKKHDSVSIESEASVSNFKGSELSRSNLTGSNSNFKASELPVPNSNITKSKKSNLNLADCERQNYNNIKLGNKMSVLEPVPYIPLNVLKRRIIICGSLNHSDNTRAMFDTSDKDSNLEMPILFIPYQVRVKSVHSNEPKIVMMYLPHMDEETSSLYLKDSFSLPSNCSVGDVVEPVEEHVTVSFNSNDKPKPEVDVARVIAPIIIENDQPNSENFPNTTDTNSVLVAVNDCNEASIPSPTNTPLSGLNESDSDCDSGDSSSTEIGLESVIAGKEIDVGKCSPIICESNELKEKSLDNISQKQKSHVSATDLKGKSSDGKEEKQKSHGEYERFTLVLHKDVKNNKYKFLKKITHID